MAFSQLDYCQFFLWSLVNHTLTYLSDHTANWSHDLINGYLRGDKLPPRLLWQNVREVMRAGRGG